MRKALVETATGKVINVIEWEPVSTWQPPADHHLEDAQNASPGDIWDGVKFNPRQPTPEEITEQTKVTKRAEAQARAVQAIKANATAAPWGRILNDLAIVQGWIEP